MLLDFYPSHMPLPFSSSIYLLFFVLEKSIADYCDICRNIANCFIFWLRGTISPLIGVSWHTTKYTSQSLTRDVKTMTSHEEVT